jgi:WD40 repeat protein
MRVNNPDCAPVLVEGRASGKPVGERMKHEKMGKSAQFSPDGQRVLTTSGDGTARVWDADSGKQIGEPMRHQGFVSSAQFRPDGQRVLTTSVGWDGPGVGYGDCDDEGHERGHSFTW